MSSAESAAEAESSNVVESPEEVVTDPELETVLDVLARILSDPNDRVRPHLLIDVTSKRYRKLRKAVTRVSKAITGLKAQRMLADEVRKQARNTIRRRIQRLRKSDRQRINDSNLRKRRIEALAKLESLGGPTSKKSLTEKPSTSRSISLEELKHARASTATEPTKPVEETKLHFERVCYTCKRRFVTLHHFYDRLCPSCAELNWQKRNAMADLNGKVILLTGARVKIGFECGKRLLRCGATVIATTRFPRDAAKRYSRLPDFPQWKDNLHIYGLDMKNIQSVVKLTELLKNRYTFLDAIINNAAQTIRRPPSYYRHLIPTELNLGSIDEDETVMGLVKGIIRKLCQILKHHLSEFSSKSAGSLCSEQKPVLTSSFDENSDR